MAKIIRMAFKPLALLLAFVQNVAAAPSVGPQPAGGLTQNDAPSLATFMKRLGQDPTFRAQFARNPRSTLRETGIDPAPYTLPDRFDTDQVTRFIGDWAGAKGPAAGLRPSRIDERPSESTVAEMMAPVYGPPPTPLPRPDRDPSRPDKSTTTSPSSGSTTEPPARDSPPAVIYGPPPGPRR